MTQEVERRQPWHRLEDEDHKQYWAFHLYLVQPGAERSIDNACRMAFPERQRAPGRWYEWASAYAWRERARAWDDHLAERERRAIAESLEGLAKARVQAYRAVLGAGMQIIATADLSGQRSGLPVTMEQARSMLGEASRMIASAGAGLRDETGKPERPKIIGITDARQLEELDDSELLALASAESTGSEPGVRRTGEPAPSQEEGSE